jgi:putative transcriptional regulator
MVRHHPSDDLLLAYAVGSSAEAVSLVVATHLALCPACRTDVERLEALGGALIEELPPAPLPEALLQQVMSRIDHPAGNGAATGPEDTGDKADTGAGPVLPRPLRDYLDGPLDALPWRNLGPISMVELAGGGAGPKAHLLRIKPGVTIPRHPHVGLELALVLAGSMSDGLRHFQRGDISQADTSVVHEQVMDRAADCLCLVATDGPLDLTELTGRLAGPHTAP